MNENRKFKDKQFEANHWLSGGRESTQAAALPELPPELPKTNRDFSPSSFLVPGWQGEGLLSKNAIKLRKLLHTLEADARNQFQKAVSFPQAKKQQIYQEFLEFRDQYDLNCQDLSSFVAFWSELNRPDSSFRRELDLFRDSFCFRSVLIYLNKVRFLAYMTRTLGMSMHAKDLGNINNLVSKIFVQGSSTQLQCDSLRSNQYSWYLPSESYRSQVYALTDALSEISVTELNKIFTASPIFVEDQEEAQFQNELDLSDLDYSHALSHRSFGLFINELLVSLPLWLSPGKTTGPKRNFACYEPAPQILTTKFLGDYLKSLTLSHWLAQENNVHQRWDKLICPDFYEPTYSNGLFHKICHELQFMSFLVHMAHIQGHAPLPLICRVMREKYMEGAQTFDQIPLWNTPETTAETTAYQRIVMNLSRLPKSNPHHYLISKISAEGKHLARHGQLIVLTNQKLFVPSHAERVTQLLKSYKLEAHFCLEHLKGKGEIPSFLYIFTKRQLETIENNFMPSFNLSAKESCASFRFAGELTRFNKFETLVDGIRSFFQQKSSSNTPVYQMELDDISLDYHQDAVFEGKLLSAHSPKDSPHITHPSFFKNLTKSCVHLGQFFQVESLPSPHQSQQGASNKAANILLGIPFARQERFPLVLIVDHRDSDHINVELINYDLYHAKFDQYGSAYFTYFGLLPKCQDININTFKEFFGSRLGTQIIQLCLAGGQAKLKSKVRSLLVPRFFEDGLTPGQETARSLQFLLTNSSKLLELHPQELKAQSLKAFHLCHQLEPQYPWYLLGLLSHFKHQVADSLLEIESEEDGLSSLQGPNYSNPLVLEPLLKLPAHKIYTENDDIFLDFLIAEPDEFLLPLTEMAIKKDADNHFLELAHDGRPILRLYADASLLDFIRFLFSSALGTSISSLIQSCRVPRAAELLSVLENFSQVKGQLEDTLGQTERMIADLLTRQITKTSC